MKRLLGWFAGAVGGAAVYRALRRQPEPATDPAEELRAKLAESKTGSDPEAGSDPAVPPGVDERRREVHEQGRAAIDELRGE